MVGRRVLALLAPVAFVVTAGCAVPDEGREGFAKTDPYESFNRTMLAGNIRIDQYVLRPTAQAYDTVTPEVIQHIVTNGLQHLALFPDIANYMLQGDVDGTLDTLGRFTINTLMGAGGFLNPADEFGLPRKPNDFGLTLAKWGVDEGPYLVLPLLGPSTARDLAGSVVDRAFWPTTYLSFGIESNMVSLLSPTTTIVLFIDERNRNFTFIDEVLYESEDPYVTVRAAYLQRRRALVAGEDDPGARLPDIFEDTDTDTDADAGDAAPTN